MDNYRMRHFAFLALTAALMMVGCKKDEETPVEPPFNTGTANFDGFVTIGNSLTAGFQSNALSQRDQPYSFPALIAQQVRTSFEQPLIKDPGIGSRLRLVNLSPLTLISETGVNPIDPASNLNGSLPQPYNNLGIPGAILFDMADTANFITKSVSRQNPFFAQILRTSALGRSVIAQAKVLQPTFMLVWIGNNDVLGYATSGGTRGTNAGLVDPPRTRPTETVLFDLWYRQLIDSLRSTGAGIVTANIPDVASIAFFTTIGPLIAANLANLPPSIYLRYQKSGNSGPSFDSTRFNLTPDVLITLLGSTYASLLGRPTGKWYSDNGYPSLPPGIDTTKPFGFHPQNPWLDALTLDVGEQTIAQNAITAFNASIDTISANRNIGVVNIYGILNTIKTQGLYYPDLGTFSTAFILGGLFSYDGVHPSTRGNAIIANEFINVINTKFNASIPLISVSSVPGLPIGKVSASGIPEIPTYPPGSLEGLIDLMNGGGR